MKSREPFQLTSIAAGPFLGVRHPVEFHLTPTANGTGQWIVLSGGPGVGKTSLLQGVAVGLSGLRGYPGAQGVVCLAENREGVLLVGYGSSRSLPSRAGQDLSLGAGFATLMGTGMTPSASLVMSGIEWQSLKYKEDMIGIQEAIGSVLPPEYVEWETWEPALGAGLWGRINWIVDMLSRGRRLFGGGPGLAKRLHGVVMLDDFDMAQVSILRSTFPKMSFIVVDSQSTGHLDVRTLGGGSV